MYGVVRKVKSVVMNCFRRTFALADSIFSLLFCSSAIVSTPISSVSATVRLAFSMISFCRRILFVEREKVDRNDH